MIEMSLKERQRLRTMSHFIDATYEIIEEEGIDNVSVRKVADIAGYNIGTLYNYFKNIDHLIGYTGVKYLKDYYAVLDDYIKDAPNAEERYIKIWELFCMYSFDMPEIWKAIFFLTPRGGIRELLDGYFAIYPEDYGEHDEDLIPMLNSSSIYERSRMCLDPVAKAGIIPEECVDEINEMTVLVYRGILERFITQKGELDKKVEIEKFKRYVRIGVDACRIKK